MDGGACHDKIYTRGGDYELLDNKDLTNNRRLFG
jgi:hypothetical protein